MPEHLLIHESELPFNKEVIQERLSRTNALTSLYPDWLTTNISAKQEKNDLFIHEFQNSESQKYTLKIQLQEKDSKQTKATFTLNWHSSRNLNHWLKLKKLTQSNQHLLTFISENLNKECEFSESVEQTPHFLIGGASGLVGKRLQQRLTGLGWKVSVLVRHQPQNDHEIFYDPLKGELDHSQLEGIDAIIHLAGASVATGRWSSKRKKELIDSRVQSTKTIVEALNQCQRKPTSFVCASGIGVYGNRGDEELSEASDESPCFLGELAQKWETEAKNAQTRSVQLRISMVLSRQGGALDKMHLPFSFGLGGKLGNGKQWVSWIHIDDLVNLILFSATNQNISGCINACSPNPIRNIEFTKSLGRAFSRPTPFPAPAFALKLALGEMADELLLTSQRVIPKKAIENDFNFQYTELGTAFTSLYP